MTFDDNLLSDAHIHLSDFAARFLAAHDVLTIVSTATPEECKTARQLAAANPYAFCLLRHPSLASAAKERRRL